MKIFFKTLIFSFCLFSCIDKSDRTGLPVIPVNSDNDAPLKLSEIVDSIRAIELEMTDESLIGRVRRVLCADDYIIVFAQNHIMQFDRNGKFLRRIGTSGQGPGEYSGLMDITLDNRNGRIYLLSHTGKIICYDIDGRFLKESPSGHFMGNPSSINIMNGKLLFLTGERKTYDGENIVQASLYQINDAWQKTDCMEVCRFKTNKITSITTNDLITQYDENVCLHFFDISEYSNILDTLYQLNDNWVVPSLRLSFRNNGLSAGGKKTIYIVSLYRSSRYVFAQYYDDLKSESVKLEHNFFFCYDMQTSKGRNMQGGYMDDIHSGQMVRIRPFASDANLFYYTHVYMDDDAKEEPNPTLYIGYLKK